MRRVALAAAVTLLVACSDPVEPSAATDPATVPTASVATTSVPPSSSSTTSTSTSTTSTSTTSTQPPTTTPSVPDFLGEEVIGTSAGGRPIIAMHRGTAGGVPVLVVGVIHGNEDAGLAITEALRTAPLPSGLDLWIIDELNPDGQADQVRGNAHGVDLNRNFPHDWTAIAQPGDWQYSGPGPASEPETQAFIAFADRIRPALTLWYHQDLNRISPSNGRDGPLRRRYAEITGLPYETVSGGTYTGVAATWVRRTVPDAMSFIVELGPELAADQVPVHVGAVLAVSEMAAADRAGSG